MTAIYEKQFKKSRSNGSQMEPGRSGDKQVGGLVSMDTHHHGGALVKREALIRPWARVPPPLGQIANVRMSR